MQVRDAPHPSSPPSDLFPVSQPTLNPDTSSWDDTVLFDRLSVHSGRPIAKGDVVSLRYTLTHAPISLDPAPLAETPSTVGK